MGRFTVRDKCFAMCSQINTLGLIHFELTNSHNINCSTSSFTEMVYLPLPKEKGRNAKKQKRDLELGESLPAVQAGIEHDRRRA